MIKAAGIAGTIGMKRLMAQAESKIATTMEMFTQLAERVPASTQEEMSAGRELVSTSSFTSLGN